MIMNCVGMGVGYKGTKKVIQNSYSVIAKVWKKMIYRMFGTRNFFSNIGRFHHDSVSTAAYV